MQRTFVASNGRDTNPCDSLDKACRNISAAITKTVAGGEVVILDSGNFQPFSVGKAITVTAASGSQPGISVTSGAGISVSAPATDVVILRGLTISSQGGARGISYNGGAALHVENCVRSGFTPLPSDCCTDAILLAFPGGRLFVKDTTARNNFNGIRITPKPSPTFAVIEHSRLENNANGLFAEDNTIVSMRDTVLNGNTFAMTAVVSAGSGPAEMNIENCLVSANGTGIVSNGTNGSFTPSTTIRVSNTTVTNNSSGLQVGSSGNPALLSRSNNTVEGNVTDGAFTGLYTAK